MALQPADSAPGRPIAPFKFGPGGKVVRSVEFAHDPDALLENCIHQATADFKRVICQHSPRQVGISYGHARLLDGYDN
jgi:hypothetical protein